jgi:hypothetical protein
MSSNQILFQDQTGIEGTSETNDIYGEALAAGDVNGDGYGDLAVGVPYEDVEDIVDAGAANVLNGSNLGLRVDNDQIWFQDQPGVEGTSETGDTFAKSLAIADYNGDGYGDLALGIPFESLGNGGEGAVNILKGSSAGVTATNSQVWFQDQPGVEGTSEAGDAFGWSLAAGDFNGDGRDDLAIGSLFENINGFDSAGAVNVLNGSDAGLTANNSQIWFQDQPGVEGTSETLDYFGGTLAAADFNGDGYDDLAIGALGESIGEIGSGGAVNILNGSSGGLTADQNQIWFQDQPGVEGTSEGGDQFGNSLTTGDFNGDGYADLAVGVTENIGDLTSAGAVNVFKGSSGGLTSDQNQIWFQDQPGVEGTSEAFDGFGSSVASGDFNGDGYDDLAIGVFGEAIGEIGAGGDFNGAGAVNVLNGSSSGLSADQNQIWFQDQPGVEGTSESQDLFGSSLSVGDFNSDGYEDLAIGVPYEDIGNIANAGASNVLFGSADGLVT